MRSVDVVKCWPFDEADEETVKTMLPPITIKKFRWWFDELELLHSDLNIESENIESMRMKKKVDKTKKKKKGLKGKLKVKLNNKAPKKRSIVELFAVSPQVERVNSDDDDDDDDDSSYNNEEEDSDTEQVLAVENVVGSKCKNMKKKKKKRKVMKKRVNKKTKNMEKDTSLVTRNATKVCHCYYRMLFCCLY